MTTEKSRKLQSIKILSILGLIISLYLVYSFYFPEINYICNDESIFSCSSVTTSKYSTLFNMPVSIFGVLWFLVLFGIAQFILHKKASPKHLLIWNSIGILFVLYLIYAELVLKTICIWCTFLHVIIVISFFLSLVMYRKSPQNI
jgi:uncharacterized membrane protein